jgi:hypothetical protein
VLAETNGRDKVTATDVDDVSVLFKSAKDSARMMMADAAAE